MISKNIMSFCRDYTKIENYDKAIVDISQIWDCHHRLEIMPWSGKQVGIQYLKEQNLYYNRPASELIFITHSEHSRLHHVGNNDLSKKISNSMIGKPHPHKGDPGRVVTKETKEKISKTLTGRHLHSQTSETKNKLSKIMSSYKWYNNGYENKRALYCPDGFVLGRLPNHKNRKLREFIQ